MVNNFCPRCGTSMERRYVEGRTRDTCTACGYIHYRNPVPAVGVVAQLEGGVVLVQRKFAPRAGYWGLPAGYMEMGESAEEAAIRECFEETGLMIQIDHLLGVYSYGDSDSSGLVIVYAATVVGGVLQAGDDALEAGIFAPDNLPYPMAFRTHLQAIEHWRQQGHLLNVQAGTLVQTGQGILVRRACRQDNERVLALLPLLSQSGPDCEVQALASDALFHDRLHDPDSPILVAEIGGFVAGFTAVSFRQTLVGRRATIDELVVDPAYRRRGLGQALIEAVVRLAQSRQCPLLYFDTLQDNADVQAFYRACGFADTGVATLQIG